MIRGKNIRLENNKLVLCKREIETEKLDFDQIKKWEIIKASASKNWLLALILGLSFIIISGLILIKAILNIRNYDPNNLEFASPRSAMTYYVSMIPLFIFGIWLLVTVIRRDYYLFLKTKIKNYKISIGDIYKNGELDKLIDILKGKIKLEN